MKIITFQKKNMKINRQLKKSSMSDESAVYPHIKSGKKLIDDWTIEEWKFFREVT